MGDALTKGTGTPWGPTEFSKPNAPQYQEYDTDINHFMKSPEIAQALEELALQGGGSQRQALAGASKAYGGGGTMSGSMGGKLANLAALTEKNQNAAATGLAGQQMDAFNRARQAKNQFMQNQYQTDLGAYGNEQASRGQAVGSILGGLTSLGGSWLGGKAAQAPPVDYSKSIRR